MRLKSSIKYIVGCIAFSIAIHSYSQQYVSIPYDMGFEEADSLELKNWVLNPGSKASQCKDQWCVGEGTACEGKRSLYISDDGGATPHFSVGGNVQYAYRDFLLPKGSYVVSFDWRCVGTTMASMYIGIAPSASVKAQMNAAPNTNTYPGAYTSFMMEDCKHMYNNHQWLNMVITGSGSQSALISSNGTRELRLFFIWSSNNQETDLVAPIGACIDNVRIVYAGCQQPENLNCEIINSDSILMTWEGSSEKYVLEYKKEGNQKWSRRSDIYGPDPSVILEGLTEGLYDFRVYGVCYDTLASAYCYLNKKILFFPENHCVNYVDLYDTINNKTTYGTFDVPDMHIGVVDYGIDNMFTRHAVIWDPNKTDERTNKQLRLIPEGELASVRLGNWDTGAEAESVTFKFHVDAQDHAILLLKYALVMQDPGHTPSAQPHFTIEITDENGELIDFTCGYVYFYADRKAVDRGDQGWHKIEAQQGSGEVLLWKDWTTVGLNLSDYDGQDLLIKITNKDCSQGGHYGYCYFTLGCASAKISNTSCGDSDINIQAPKGFLYQWYYSDHVTPVPDELGGKSEHIIIAPSDTTTYYCRLTSVETSDCHFELSTSSMPRYPVADFEIKYEPANCENRVRFVNKSHIKTVANEVETHHYDEPTEVNQWEFSNGESHEGVNPVMMFPKEGGKYSVTLTTSISEGQCMDEITKEFTIPAIGDTLLNKDSVICDGSYAIFGDKYSDSTYLAAEQGAYKVTWKSMAGCDSTWIYNLIVHEQSVTNLPDTILCAEDVLIIDGEKYKYSTSGKFVRFRKNKYGCDSTIQMNVIVLDSIIPTVNMIDIQGDVEYSGELHLGGTGYTYYMLNGVRHESTDLDIMGLNGGEMHLMFFNDHGCYKDSVLYMTYPCRNLIFQRWNDVLSVYNSQTQKTKYPNMPDLSYTSFQWMKDSVDIPGAVMSYYYEEPGLDLNSFYQVRVITTDGEILISCPFYPEAYEEKSAPNKRKVIENQKLVIIIDGIRYNAQGQRL